MTDITITATIPKAVALRVIDEIMANFPEASRGSSLECHRFNYKERKFAFVDLESADEDKTILFTEEKMLAAFPLMFSSKWPRGCPSPPLTHDMKQWDDWLWELDAISHDAFAQLVAFGEVIYG